MGFDQYGFRPLLHLAVVSSLEHPRKGKALVDAVSGIAGCPCHDLEWKTT